MKFRRATVNDIESMSEIRIAVTENPLSDPSLITPKMYQDYLERLGRSWVCEVDSKIIGFSAAEIADNSIWALFVSPEEENKGAGKQLLKLATDWLFSLGAQKVMLGTEINTRADEFYKLQGWERGEMKDQYEVSYTLWRNDYS